MERARDRNYEPVWFSQTVEVLGGSPTEWLTAAEAIVALIVGIVSLCWQSRQICHTVRKVEAVERDVAGDLLTVEFLLVADRCCTRRVRNVGCSEAHAVEVDTLGGPGRPHLSWRTGVLLRHRVPGLCVEP